MTITPNPEALTPYAQRIRNRRGAAWIPPKLGESLLTPGSLGYITPITPPIVPAAITPIPPRRGISIAVDCRAIQRFVSWKIPPRTQNACPPPPVANPCGTAPPACQPFAAPAGGPVYQKPWAPVIQPPCFGPCGA